MKRDLHVNIQLEGHNFVSSWALHSEVFLSAQRKLNKLCKATTLTSSWKPGVDCYLRVVLQPQHSIAYIKTATVENLIRALLHIIYYCTGHAGGESVAESLLMLKRHRCHGLVKELVNRVTGELAELALLSGDGLTGRFRFVLQKANQEKRPSSPSEKEMQKVQPDHRLPPKKERVQCKRQRLSKVKVKLHRLQKLLSLKVEENMRLQEELIKLTGSKAEHNRQTQVGTEKKAGRVKNEREEKDGERNHTTPHGNEREEEMQKVAKYLRKDFALCQVFSSIVLIQLTLYKIEQSITSDLCNQKDTTIHGRPNQA